MSLAEPGHLCRSKEFGNSFQPLEGHASLQLVPSEVSGPFSFLNPTRAHFRHKEAADEEGGLSEKCPQRTDGGSDNILHKAEQVEYRWNPRNNRKGRHQLDVTPKKDGKYLIPESTSSIRAIAKNLFHMLTHYPYWDISWLVAYIFTWGSIVWVINSFFVWLPLVRPSSEFENEINIAGGITAFIGATIFVGGSILLMLEAVNENRAGCFGWAVEQVFEETGSRHKGGWWRLKPDFDHCTHHHLNKGNLVGNPSHSRWTAESTGRGEGTGVAASWVWFPSKQNLRTHYVHELGFLACCAQMTGATIFWISGYTALPGVLNHLSPGLEDGIFWTPQVIGGSGFIISGLLFMLETQKKWYLPAFDTLGWHIGLWNTIGGIGFTLCPVFGYDTASWAVYQSSLSTFWASWAFLVGSLIQLYESLQKHPVDYKKSLVRAKPSVGSATGAEGQVPAS
jgi:hypothetical protein